MNLIFIWLITYAIPGIFAGGLVKLLPSRSVGLSKRNILIMHGALLVSTLASQYAVYTLEFSFPWFPDGISFFVYVASVLAAVFLLGSMGGGMDCLLFYSNLPYYRRRLFCCPLFRFIQSLYLLFQSLFFVIPYKVSIGA